MSLCTSLLYSYMQERKRTQLVGLVGFDNLVRMILSLELGDGLSSSTFNTEGAKCFKHIILPFCKVGKCDHPHCAKGMTLRDGLAFKSPRELLAEARCQLVCS